VRAQENARPSLNDFQCLARRGHVAAFQFTELRQVRWQLGDKSKSTVVIVEGANSGHGHIAEYRYRRSMSASGADADTIAPAPLAESVANDPERTINPFRIRRARVEVTSTGARWENDRHVQDRSRRKSSSTFTPR